MKKLFILLAPLFISMVAFSPSKSFEVSGIVKDDMGNPVVSASVVEKGTKNGVATDAKGFFKLTVSGEKAVLLVSAVGFETKEIKLKGKNSVNVSLSFSESQLTEVVVVGYSTVRKKDLTGSVSRINGASIYGSNAPYSSAPYALSGKAAGVQIRGAGSINKTIPDKTILLQGNNRQGNLQNDSLDTDFDTEDYDRITENPFLKVNDNPLSTFSIDVDAASYSNIRRFINMKELPPAGAVRIEEMINYFKYDYNAPAGDEPFAVYTEMSECSWNSKHRLVMVGLQGKKIETENLPPSNLVFLIDVSGSMQDYNKLPLVKESMKLLIDQLREQDKVSIVAYAGNAGLVLAATSGAEKNKIEAAIDRLEAGGSTAGGQGIQLAYKIAKENFAKGGNNRVILCTDGDFNVGVSSDDALERLIENERSSGVFLTVLGYGMGNYKDNKMQKLADKGNGNHAYIDGLAEAKKVLVSEFGGTLFTIARDVKLQVEFNPAKVQGYRLIGYENRLMAKEDFNDDKKDAGDLGSGHTVTALYEIIPVGIKSSWLKEVDDLRYQKNKTKISSAAKAEEIMNIQLRYKQPDGVTSKLIQHPVTDNHVSLENSSNNFRFASAVAEFGLLLRKSAFKNNASFTHVISQARKAKGEDKEGYRKDFIKLVADAGKLAYLDVDEDEEDSKPVSKN